uniref:Uncharacterized protein n=1 Tax=viral metagenome TaxID=1070528 RepID=A0A6M3KYZ6_9ZZZZ
MGVTRSHTFCKAQLELVYPDAEVRVADGEYYIPSRVELLAFKEILLAGKFGYTSEFPNYGEFALTGDEFLRHAFRYARRDAAYSVSEETGELLYPTGRWQMIDDKLWFVDEEGLPVLPDRYNYHWLGGHAWGRIAGGSYKAVFWMADTDREFFYTTSPDGPVREATGLEDIKAIRVGC